MSGEELSILNEDRKTLPGPEYLQDLIDWSRTSATAIDFWTASGDVCQISYTLLDDLTSALAERIVASLKATKTQTEDVIIPVLISQSPELYISWIAILKAGAAFCPIAIDSPAERVNFILQDVSASLVITTASHEGWLAKIAPSIPTLCVSQSSLESTCRRVPPRGAKKMTKAAPSPESLAYIMYTSGSTGLPKGVKISHKAVCQALLAHDEHLPTFLRFLQFASPTFDVSVFETFFPLFRGVTLVGRERESMLADLPGTIRAMDVDAAELTPTVAGTLLKHREAAPCLQLLLTIGEMLAKPIIDEFGESETMPGILYAMYGPTEASIHCTIATKVRVSSSIHNIGKPLATVTAIIIEASAGASPVSILPKGQVGELAVAGQLASGYLNRPEQTAAAFVNLPGYGMFYRTGDRARVAENGNLEMLGRMSSGQVKLRGQRVELGEIESVACRLDAVIIAAASIINEALVLFCVLDGGQTTVADVQKTCKKHLLNFMVPGDIVLLNLSSIPRLPSGKMDRKKIEKNYVKLKSTEIHHDTGVVDFITAQVCRCVSEELGHQVSPATALWAEGFNSLVAIKVASALRFEQIEVSVGDLLEVETIAQVVAKIKARATKADVGETPAIPLIEDTDAWEHVQRTVETTLGPDSKAAFMSPCTSIQVAMLTETMSNAKLNFNSIELELNPGITFSDIRSAIQVLAQENEILRSGFVPTDHDLVPFVQVVWDKMDLDQCHSLLHPLKIKPSNGSSNKFVVEIHHALYDGWSWDSIMTDLDDLLRANPIVKRPPFRYISREQRRLQQSQQEAAKEYWRGLLATATPFRLPQLHDSRDSNSTNLVQRRRLRTSTHTLVASASRLHLSSQTILSAAVSLLLSSYTGSPDVVFGLVSSGRHLPIPGIEKVIGPCLSTLPLIMDLSSMRTVRDLVLHIHSLELSQLEHSTLSLHDILATTRTSPEQKLFDTIFVWQESLSSRGRETKIVKVNETHDCLDYALVIEAEPLESEVVVKVTCDPAKLSPQCAERLLGQLDHLVTAIVANDGTILRDVWDTCEPTFLAAVNPQPKMFDQSFDLTSTIRELAEKAPERIAISFTHDFDPETSAARTEDLNYGDLSIQSSRTACFLQSLDIGLDDIVCVLVDKSLDLYVLDLAIIAAGGAFLNVDTRTPAARLIKILTEVNCKLVITADGNLSSLVSETVAVPSMSLSTVKVDALNYRNMCLKPQANLNGSHLAYAVMTSGTTGIPKAILVTRMNLLSNIDILSRTYPRYNKTDALLQGCSPAFDVFVFELFWTWHMGMRLSTSTNDVLYRDIESFIRTAKVSHLSLTPSVAALIHPDNVPGVKFLVTAGEPMNLKVFNNWAGRGLFQGYGPAETTNVCNVKGLVQPNDLINNVGRPFGNTSIFICAKQSDDRARPEIQILPFGAVGEIVIGGDQVARGYANNALTAKSFIDTKYGRLYRSGDMGRLVANGNLVVLGREDDQVKLRGQRIELGDINSAIVRAPFVRDAATLVIEKNHSNVSLVSFWVAHDEQRSSNLFPDLYELLEASLLPYMIPDNLIEIDAMPLTRQGKIDKHALREHYNSLDNVTLEQLGKAAATSDTSEDFTGEEKLIAHVLSEVTDTSIDKISPNTSFYSLGLDSISSVRLAQKLRQANIGNADVSLILKNCSVRRLQRALVNHNFVLDDKSKPTELDEIFHLGGRNKILSMVEAKGWQVEKILPCTALQESILISQIKNQHSMTYEARMKFKVRGDADTLRTAWSRVVKRHQILRTAFVITHSTEYAYAQVVLKDFELPCCAPEEEASIFAAKSEDSFSPPWHLTLNNSSCPGEQNNLTLVMSHALYDFEALATLLKEVELIYRAQKLPSVVSPDYYTRYMLNMNPNEVDNFWQSLLNGYNPRSLTQLFQTKESLDGRQRTYTYSSKISQDVLQNAAEKSSVTSATLLQAAWARLLSCYLETEDVVFGSVFSGRNLPLQGAEHIVAPLFNTLPLRVRLTGRQSIYSLTAEIYTTVLEMLPFQPSRLRQIIRNQKLGVRPLFDTMVLVQRKDLVFDETIWFLQENEGDMDFPGLILEIIPHATNGCFVVKLHVQSGNIDSSAAHQILRNYNFLLEEIAQYPQAQSNNFTSIESDLPLLKARDIISLQPQGSVKLTRVHTNNEEFTDLELSIRDLFAQFSGIDKAEIHMGTSIFELGLDSLHVVQIASELRALGHAVTGADVLEAQTIEKLSQKCVMTLSEDASIATKSFDLHAFDKKHRVTVCEQLGLSADDVQIIRPCTPTQSGILTQFINSKGLLYFNSILLELRADIDLVRLRTAWQTVMNRNEILRTGFVILNTSNHTYGMITYVKDARGMPWSTEKDLGHMKRENLGESCLQRLYDPCWRLLLRRIAGSIRLEVCLLHSLYDANSLAEFLSEVAVIYQDQGSTLPDPVPIAPALCAILDQSEASRNDREHFWRNLGAQAQPSKFPNLEIRHSGQQDSFTFSKTFEYTLQDLEKRCRELGVTLQSVCQVAWAKLLAAYTGDPKVMFGIVLSGRTLPQTANVPFPTINTVPFSLQVSKNEHSMLKEASEINIGLYKHQFTPATNIKRWLGVEGELYDTILVLQKTQSAQRVDPPWQVLDDRAAAEYAISMEVLPRSNASLELRITARPDVIPANQATVLLSQYEVLLREVVQKNPQELSIPQSLQSIVVAKDELIPTRIRLLHDFVEATYVESPDAIALEFAYSIVEGHVDMHTWTYSQLNAESNKIANLLLAFGVKVGDYVAVCFDKCPEASSAILAVLKAGCAYVAIDPAAPFARKKFILQDAGCKVLLTMRSLLFSVNDSGQTAMLAVDDEELVRSRLTTSPVLDREVQSSDTCYCLYTSGTTGQPKGCLITHASAVQAMLSFQRIFAGHWDKDSRWLQFASFHFDVSVLEQYWSWSVGIRVTSAPRDVLFEDIPGAIHALQITHLDLTPSLARMLTPEQVPSLCRGVFIVGGEQVSQDIIDTWGDVGCLYNFYGPSEVTIGCTVHKRVKKGVKATNIGQPWDNVGAFVLDPGSETPVLRGAIGELCLSGPLVGKGYLNRPELTAEKFVTLEKYNVRVYRSGDLVRLLHDDSFEFLGRIDDQVKLRGQRLEIREIDQAIKQASHSIADVATMVLKHAHQPSEQLIAFFTIRGSVAKSSAITTLTSSMAGDVVSQIRRHLQDRLPTYMVPTQLLSISHIPLSPNNKADLKALREYFASKPVPLLQNMDWNGISIVPMTKTTKKVIDILAKFLMMPMDAISPSSRLFELGLDSISAVGFANVLREAGFTSADAATVMRKPVVADLAHELDASRTNEYEDAVETAKIDIAHFRKAHKGLVSSLTQSESIWPCTPLQEDMLSKTVHRGDIPYYLSTFYYAVGNSVTSDAVRNAWEEAQRRLSILRTVFVEVSNNQYAQIIAKECVTPVRNHTLMHGEHAMTFLKQNASEWCKAADVLDHLPCWKVEVVENSLGKVYMSLSIFHGLYDANSLHLMLKKVTNLIRDRAVELGKQNLEFHEALPYGPLCHREGTQEFWMRKISSPVLLNLPPIHSGSEESSVTSCVEHHLPEGFRDTKKRLAVTESAIFQAAYLLSLYSRYGIFPSFGMVVSGRSFPMTGVEEICGPLFNTIPVQIIPENDWSGADLIKSCHDFNVEAKPFEHTSLRQIRQWAGLGSGTALFDAIFVFQKENKGTADNDENLLSEIGQTSTSDHPLNIQVELKKDVFELTVVVDPEFLSEVDLHSLSAYFLSSLEHLVRGVDEPLLPKEGQKFAVPQSQSVETIRKRGPIDPSILRQVKSQVALLAQQDITDFADEVNLFSLGLDSISLIKLSGALKKCGTPVSVNMIMRLSTPADIAEYLTDRQQWTVTDKESGESGHKPLEAAQLELRDALQRQNVSLEHVEKFLPVTPMQEGILANFEKYYHFALLKLSADTDLDRLRSAWGSAITLHPVLRTRFVAIDDPTVKHVFAQLIVSSHRWRPVLVHTDDESRIQDTIVESRSKMIEAGSNYPSFVMQFITCANTGNRYILIGMSHAIYDGWSIQLLHEDIATLYNGHQIQRPPVEPYLQYISTRELEIASSFWAQQMSSYVPESFPALAIQRDEEPKTHMVTLESRTQSSVIQRFCMDHSITTQTLGLAIWTTVLWKYLKKHDICFGVVLACRNTEDADQLMFPTFNTVPFRPRFHGGSHLDLLKHIHRLGLQVAEHQDYPLREIKKAYSGSSGSSADLFDTLFVFQKRPSSVKNLPKLYEEVELGKSPSLDYPVNVEMDLGEKLRWTVAVSGSTLDEDGLQMLLEQLESTLEVVLWDPNGVVMATNDTEHAPATVSTQSAPNTDNSLHRSPTRATDTALRATILTAIASVTRCNVDALSGDTNIYSLGLDSISVVKVTGLLRKKHILLPVSKIVAAATVDKIVEEARRINNPKHSAEPRATMTSNTSNFSESLRAYISAQDIAENAIEVILPASAGQFFMLDYYHATGRRLFYPTFRYRIPGEAISQDQILHAWDVVIQAFPALRTRFIENDEEIWQLIIKPEAIERYPPAADLTVSREQGARGLVVQLQLHHALYDALSLRIVVSAFERLCQGQVLQLDTGTNDRNIRGFIDATRGDATKTTSREFWTDYLTQPHVYSDSTDGLGSGTFTARRVEAFQENVVTDIKNRRLIARAAGAGVSLQALFLAAVGRVYASLSSQSDTVVLGIYLANRGLDIEGFELENLAAPTVNVVPLVVDTKADLLKSARGIQRDLAVIQRMENCGVTLREVYEWTGVRLNWFVNFLPTGGDDEEHEDGDRDGDGDMYGHGNGDMRGGDVTLVPYPYERRDEDTGNVGQHLTSPLLTSQPDPDRQMPWCVPSVDVEAKLEAGGGLTIGVFAPEDMLDQEGVRRVLGEIREALVNAAGVEQRERNL